MLNNIKNVSIKWKSYGETNTLCQSQSLKL